MRVATYARYSSDQQRESSIADQQRNCHARAAQEGWKVTRDFADAAISGSDRKRPQYQRMLAAGKAREFDALLIDDLSRLTRDSVEQETVLRRLEFGGIRVIGCSDGYDTMSPSRKVTRAIRGLTNEMFLDDLSQKVHRGQKGVALKGCWNGGKPFGYKLRPVLDPSKKDPYGNLLRVATVLEVDKEQALVVRSIFERYAEGASCLTIAKELNARGVASPGATWRRVTRRKGHWMNSSVRVILENQLYIGKQSWNKSQFVRDPDSGNHLRRLRPVVEWVVNDIPELRIIPAALFEKVEARRRKLGDADPRRKAGGKSKYILSGLLKCGTCGAHFIMGDAHKYACSSFLNGRACANTVRVRRDALEQLILGPVRDELLSPERVVRMGKEIQREYSRASQASAARAVELPQEMQKMDARLARLRDRQKLGDPDMTAAELQGVIDRIQAERARLIESQSGVSARDVAKLAALLPGAAEEYRKQIAIGLDGNPTEAAKGRLVLRDLIGPVTLTPGDQPGQLWGSYMPSFSALLKTAGTQYRGDRI